MQGNVPMRQTSTVEESQSKYNKSFNQRPAIAVHAKGPCEDNTLVELYSTYFWCFAFTQTF